MPTTVPIQELEIYLYRVTKLINT